jgi:hypothetical protein
MKEDFTNGDHSFKNWFKIMWSNSYIQLFVVALVILFLIVFNLSEEELWVILLPISMMVVIVYKGFYQFWNDLKNGKSR